jgi:hypothetical protein
MYPLRVILLSAAVAAAGLTPAVADPLNDDFRAIRKEFCAGGPFSECLASFRAEVAAKASRHQPVL